MTRLPCLIICETGLILCHTDNLIRRPYKAFWHLDLFMQQFNLTIRQPYLAIPETGLLIR